MSRSKARLFCAMATQFSTIAFSNANSLTVIRSFCQAEPSRMILEKRLSPINSSGMRWAQIDQTLQRLLRYGSASRIPKS